MTRRVATSSETLSDTSAKKDASSGWNRAIWVLLCEKHLMTADTMAKGTQKCNLLLHSPKEDAMLLYQVKSRY